MNEDYITLTNDDGLYIECLILGTFIVDAKEYIALEPQDDSGDIWLYGYKPEGDEFELLDIEDDDEFEAVSDEFDRIIDSME